MSPLWLKASIHLVFSVICGVVLIDGSSPLLKRGDHSGVKNRCSPGYLQSEAAAIYI